MKRRCMYGVARSHARCVGWSRPRRYDGYLKTFRRDIRDAVDGGRGTVSLQGLGYGRGSTVRQTR